MAKFIEKLKEHQAEKPKVPEFVYVIMSPNYKTHHIFLLDMVTENYKLVRTLTDLTRRQALAHVKDLATKTAEELHTDSLSLGRLIDAEILKYQKETDEPVKGPPPTSKEALDKIKKSGLIKKVAKKIS